MTAYIRIALDDAGFAGQWLDVIDLGALSPRQFGRISELGADRSPEGAVS